MSLETAFGLVLKRHRVLRNLSQEELSFKCGMDRTYISLLERGKRKPTITTLFILAKGLDTKASILIKEVEKEISDCSN